MADTDRINIDATYMRFDPNDSKFYKKITTDIPAFAEYKSEFIKTEQAKRKLFAWIVCMYDIHTPLRREIKDLYKRKVYAGNICRITPNAASGKYKKHVEKIMLGQDPVVNDLIVKFIMSFASQEYMQLIAHSAIQYYMLEKIVRGEANKNIQSMFDAATAKIKELTNIIYGSGERDEVYEARRALYRQVAFDLSDMRMENVARRMANGEGLPADWNPYDNYIPDDIKFAGDDISIAEEDEESLP